VDFVVFSQKTDQKRHVLLTIGVFYF